MAHKATYKNLMWSTFQKTLDTPDLKYQVLTMSNNGTNVREQCGVTNENKYYKSLDLEIICTFIGQGSNPNQMILMIL